MELFHIATVFIIAILVQLSISKSTGIVSDFCMLSTIDLRLKILIRDVTSDLLKGKYDETLELDGSSLKFRGEGTDQTAPEQTTSREPIPESNYMFDK